MPTILIASKKVDEKMEKLPRVSFMGYWNKYATLEFPFAGKFEVDKDYNEYVPLVWKYFPDIGAWKRMLITDTTNGVYLGFSFSKSRAQGLMERLNNCENGVYFS